LLQLVHKTPLILQAFL